MFMNLPGRASFSELRYRLYWLGYVDNHSAKFFCDGNVMNQRAKIANCSIQEDGYVHIGTTCDGAEFHEWNSLYGPFDLSNS